MKNRRSACSFRLQIFSCGMQTLMRSEWTTRQRKPLSTPLNSSALSMTVAAKASRRSVCSADGSLHRNASFSYLTVEEKR